jgi:hypothetical protein
MTKLLIAFAVVVVVLVLAFFVVRNRRTRDAGDFEDEREDRGGRGGRNWGDSDRAERPGRHPGHGGRAGLSQAGEPRRPARSGGDQRAAHSRAGRRSEHGEPGYGPRQERGAKSGRGQQRARARSSDHAGPGYPPGQERGADVERDQLRARSRSERRDSDGASRHRPDEPVQSHSRLGRSRRSDDSADWPSTEWDKLSDVDYWAELASDKPLTTTAQPARPSRTGQGSGTNALADPDAGDSQVPGRAGNPGLPARSRPQLAAAPVSTPLLSPDFVESLSTAPRPVAAREPDLDPVTIPGGTAPQTRPRRSASADNDPLTSPSFPRIPASDSRSYRGKGNGYAPDSPDAAYNAPTQQFASYGRPAARSSGTGGPVAESQTRPSAYPDAIAAPAGQQGDSPQAPGLASTDRYPTVPGSRGRHESSSAPAGADSLSAAGALPPPSGNPYGSYVSTPPSGGFPAAGSAAGHNGAGSGTYHAAPGPVRPGQDLTGHSSGAYPPAQDTYPRAHDAPGSYFPVQDAPGFYPPAQDVSGSYPPPQDLNGWYPRQADRPAPVRNIPGELPDPGSSDARRRGQRSDDGHYYPATSQPGSWPADGYPDNQPGQADYARGRYPHPQHERPVPRAQDPYAPDGYGGHPGYDTFGR